MVTDGIILPTPKSARPIIPSDNMASVGRYKGRGTPNGAIPASIGADYLDENSGDSWRKNYGDRTRFGWIKESDTVSLADFVPEGQTMADGVGDDSATFEAALEALRSTTILGNSYVTQKILIPTPPQGGYYRITRPIRITTNGVQLIGETQGIVIKNVSTNSDVIQVNPILPGEDITQSAIKTRILYNVHIENLTLNGTGIGSRAIYAQQTYHLRVDVNTFGHGGGSIYLESAPVTAGLTGFGYGGCLFSRITILAQPSADVTCIYDAGGRQNVYDQCHVSRCNKGFHFVGCDGNVLVAPQIETVNRGTADGGIYVRSATGLGLTKRSLIIQGAYCENATNYFIDADDSAFVIVDTATLVGGTGDKIRLNGGGRLTGVSGTGAVSVSSNSIVECVSCQNIIGLAANLRLDGATLPLPNGGSNSATNSWFDGEPTWGTGGGHPPTFSFDTSAGFYGKNSKVATFPTGATGFSDSIATMSNVTISTTVGDQVSVIIALKFDTAGINMMMRLNTTTALVFVSKTEWMFLTASYKTDATSVAVTLAPNQVLVSPLAASVGGVAIAKNQQPVLYNTDAPARDQKSLTVARGWLNPDGEEFGRSRAEVDTNGLYFDGSAGTKTTTPLGSQVIGAGPATICFTFRCPLVTPASDTGLYSIATNATQHGSNVGDFTAYFEAASGSILLRLNGTGGTRIQQITSFCNRFGGQIVTLFVVRTAGTIVAYVNGVVVSGPESITGPGPSDWSDSWAGVYFHTGIRTSAQVLVSTIYSDAIFNRALTASEVRRFSYQGVEYTDRWGSQAVLNSGTFILGRRYRIVTRTDGSFTSVGAANNTVGTEFIATATGAGVLDAGDTAVAIGAMIYRRYNIAGTVTIPDISANALDATIAGGVQAIGSNLYNVKLGDVLQFQIDKSVTATNVRMQVWDVDTASLKRVSVGANDSGGSGFKLLRIPNS